MIREMQALQLGAGIRFLHQTWCSRKSEVQKKYLQKNLKKNDPMLSVLMAGNLRHFRKLVTALRVRNDHILDVGRMPIADSSLKV